MPETEPKDHSANRLLELHTYLDSAQASAAHASGPTVWLFIDGLSEARKAALSAALDTIEMEVKAIVEFAEIIRLSKGQYPSEALMTARAV